MTTDSMSVQERTYIAFEQGEGRTQRYELARAGKIWWSDGRLLAREIYGTPEENNNNVFRAIANNLGGWLNRLKWNVRDFFLSWQEAFLHHAPPLFIAALWGWGLMWRYHTKQALIFLLIFAPTSFFFLITFWQDRYIVIFTPIYVLLAIYGLNLISKMPEPGERKWGVFISILAAGAIIVFYYLGRTRDMPFSTFTLLWTLLLYGVYIWRFVIQGKLHPRFLRTAMIVALVFLVIGVYRTPPIKDGVTTIYHHESTAYVIDAFYQYSGERVCIRHQDHDAMSLAFYARQVPVRASVNIYDELVNGTLAATMERFGCQRALIAGTGWLDRSMINSPTVFNNTDANILFRSNSGIIVLFDLTSQ